MTPDDNHYRKKFKSIVNVLKTNSSKLNVSGISLAGSRARQQQGSESGEDIIISAAHDPSKPEFYPELMKVLEDNFPTAEIDPGGNYNVVHMDTKEGGKIDLVLRSEAEFDRQHQNDIKYRRNNL